MCGVSYVSKSILSVLYPCFFRKSTKVSSTVIAVIPVLLDVAYRMASNKSLNPVLIKS